MKKIMYSAESTLQDINDVDDLQHKIDCIKKYGKQCAIQALKDAAKNAKIAVINCMNGHISLQPYPFSDPDGDTISIDKESITQTKIITP